MSKINTVKAKNIIIKCESVFKIFVNNTDKIFNNSNGKIDTVTYLAIDNLIRS